MKNAIVRKLYLTRLAIRRLLYGEVSYCDPRSNLLDVNIYFGRMKNAIVRTLTRLAIRPAVIMSISFAMFLFAACESNAPSGPQDLNGQLSKATRLSKSAVPLGAASSFAVLGATTVTNTGATVLNGDAGVSPGTAMTGFLEAPGPVTFLSGAIHAGDALAAQAHSDAVTAYNALVVQPGNFNYVADQELNNLILTPGVHSFPSSAHLDGTLILDFQGNSDALFIFNIGSTLTTITGSKVTVVNNGGQSNGSNVYWAVGSSATLGTGTQFVGNILAVESITLTTGVSMSGSALALNGAVTMDTDTISVCGAAPDVIPPTVISTDPANNATGVALNKIITATFSEAMDQSTITTGTFTLQQGATPVSGTVSYTGTTATFTPVSNLAASTLFTATMTTGAKDLAGNALASNYVWSFTTGAAPAAGQAPVDLGSAGNYVILAKSGITTTGTTAVVGDIGVSPIAATAITGFALILDASNQFSTSSLVTGKVYAADYAVPTPSNLTTAVLDMQTAYTDAAGRPLPDFTELGAGNIDGMTLVPGLYKWGTVVTIPSGVTLTGGANDVWIFQIAQGLTVGNGAIVTLSGGAQAKNIFWQVAGQTTLGTTSDFKGIVLCQTAIVLNTGAVMNGRALAQTAVTLIANAITAP